MSARDVNPSEIGKYMPEARRAIIFAGVLGWSVRWANQNRHVIALRAADGKEISVPSTNINSNRYRSWISQIIRHTPNEVLLDFYTGKFMSDMGLDTQKITSVIGAEVVTSVAEYLGEQAIAAMAAETEQEVEQTRDSTVAEKEVPVAVAAQPDTVSEQPTLVSTRPWMARRSGVEGGQGKMYESPNVVVEVYSDGTEVFRCRHCRYSNENPRSVSAHGSRAHPETKASPHPVLRPVKNYESSGLHREMSAARRLAADITSALDSVEDWHGMDASALALALAERIIEARPDRAPAEPLTDQQVIARITALVDGGRLADMHQQVQRISAALAEAEEARAAAEARADKWHGDLQAVREMLSEGT